MAAKAWIFQYPKDVKAVGAAAVAWYTGWCPPVGKRKAKSFGTGPKGKKDADAYRRKIEGQLAVGAYIGPVRVKWSDFRKMLDAVVIPTLTVGNQEITRQSLTHFERLADLGKLANVSEKTFAGYVA